MDEFDNIKSIPKNIGKLVHLKNLDLSYNQIETLPSSFKKLVNLKYLDLTIIGITIF